MTIAPDPTRTALRRAVHDANASLADLLVRLTAVDPEATQSVRNARSALFEAWTILCTPPEDDDDDHAH